MITVITILTMMAVVSFAIAIRSFIWRDKIEVGDTCYYGWFTRCEVIATDTECCNYGDDHWCTTIMAYVRTKNGNFWIDVKQLYVL